MTSALPIFELEMYRAERLDYALRYLRNHETEIDPAMAKAQALALPIPVSTKEEFLRMVLGAVAIGSLALFWRGFHRYRTNLRPEPTQEAIEKACPDYKVRCHRRDPEDHVLRFLRDLRNTEIHPGARFRYITCKRSPDEIIFQPLVIRELPDKRVVFLFHDLDVPRQLKWVEKVQAAWASIESTTFGEFLTGEAATCVRSFDAQRDGRPPLQRKPIEYAPDPATLGI